MIQSISKMYTLKLFLICALIGLALAENAKNCDAKNCKLPSCICSGNKPSVTGTLPQLVALSFDDSTTKLISDSFYETVLFTRKNPDGCPISGTFYVPHEYTDYTVVNQLYNKGFEIGSHSITKNYSAQYWNNATSDLIKKEMLGQKTVISKFANIPAASIIGARIPHFQLNGDYTYRGLQDAGFVYDNSWPSYTFKPLFPYTLDYASEQSCLVGTCPKESHPGFWIIPINNWMGMDQAECNKLLACNVTGDATNIFNWMVQNFNREYNGNRAPISLVINYAWFSYVDGSQSALEKFLDYLKTKKDVFVVSNDQVLNWIKNPVPADKFSSCKKISSVSCQTVNCRLQNEDGNDRYMGACVACPARYPSVDNPLGAK